MENTAAWTEEWYTTWKAPNDARDESSSCTGSEFLSRSETHSHAESRSISRPSDSVNGGHHHNHHRFGYSFTNSSTSELGTDVTDDDSWEELPECGELINVKPKIGERVSRIHPDYTSQLRRSRWRKKYFPRGTFPYDK